MFVKNKIDNYKKCRLSFRSNSLKYHVVDKCKSTCSKSKPHVKLEPQTLIVLCILTKSVKENYNSFRENRRKDKNSETNSQGESG